MASKPLNTLTTDECRQYYDILVSNADSQWQIADTLADAGQYGAATSHLLISVEESIKSIIVFMDTQGFDFRSVKGIDTIFRNHRIRFFIAYIMFAVGIVGEDLIKLLKKIKENPSLLEDYMKLLIKEDDLPIALKWYFLRKAILLRKEKALFEKADLFRQIGFYADFNEEVNSPQTMSKETYNMIYERMLKVKKFTASFIRSYTPSDDMMLQLIQDNKKMFNDNKVYNMLELGLSQAKSSKKSPFEILDKF
jgi:AbiV family abortive infection protein